MSQFDTPDRTHVMTSSPGSTRMELSGSAPQYAWRIDLSAKRSDRFVEIRILDRLVVELSPAEAREFAKALLKVASD